MFIVLEGVDKVGKTTAIENTATRLRKDGYDVTTISESNDPIVQYIKQSDLGIETIVDLFDDMRNEHQDLISNFVDDDKILLWDRYYDSTYVYGYRSLHEDPNVAYNMWNNASSLFYSPDITFYFNANVDLIVSRIADEVDRFTNGSVVNVQKYLDRYYDLYFMIANLRTIVTLDVTNMSITDVASKCFSRIVEELSYDDLS